MAKTITKREYYDLIMAAVKSGRLPSVDHTVKKQNQSTCLYRANGGANACVVGLLIEDEDYDPRMEGKSAWCVIYDFRDKVTKVEGLTAGDFGDIQRLHDKQFADNNEVWDADKFVADINDSIYFKEFAPQSA